MAQECEYRHGWYHVEKAERHREMSGHPIGYTYVQVNIEAGRMPTARAWCTTEGCERSSGWHHVAKAWEHAEATGHRVAFAYIPDGVAWADS